MGLAAALALFALESAAEIVRLRIGGPLNQDDGEACAWLAAVVPRLEATRAAFPGKISALVAGERARGAPGQPAATAASGGAPLLNTKIDQLARLSSMNRAPSYATAGKGWNHPDGKITRDWTGANLVPCKISPSATQLPTPLAEVKDYVKRSCPSVVGDKILGNQCPSCTIKTTRGGCVCRYNMIESGPAFQQGQLSPLETPSLALPWNLDGEPKRLEDEDERGFPSYLEGGDPPGWPLPEEYDPSRRPCGVPTLRGEDTPHTVPPVRRRPRQFDWALP